MSKRKTVNELPVFKDADAANEAATAFFADVREARAKHGLHHVWIVVCPFVREEREGEPVDMLNVGSLRLGSDAELLPMVAAAYGKFRNEFVDRVDKAAARTK